MFTRSPSGAPSATAACASFSTGTDSPVSADSSLLRLADSISRASAGTKSPASTRMMSPGTRSLASMTASRPLRSTRACGADMLLSASMAFSALLSCIMPMMALRMTMARISAGSRNSRVSPLWAATKKEMMAAMMRMIIIVSLNWARKRIKREGFFCSRSTFLPYFWRACSSCAWLRPFCGSASKCLSRSPSGSV